MRAATSRSSRRPLSRRELLSLEAVREASASSHWVRVFRRAMACRFEVTLPSEDARHVAAARDALDLVDLIEDRLTWFRATSELSQVNREAACRPVPVSPELLELLGLCRRIHGETAGAFDVTTTPLSRAWGFLDRAGRLALA